MYHGVLQQDLSLLMIELTWSLTEDFHSIALAGPLISVQEPNTLETWKSQFCVHIQHTLIASPLIYQ